MSNDMSCCLQLVHCYPCMCFHDSWCIHTSTGHLWRVGVSAVVAVTTDTISCPLACGSTVNGALQTFMVSLCSLKES